MFQQTPQKRVTIRRALTSIGLGVLSIATILYGGFALHPQKVLAATNNNLNFQARLENTAGAIAPDGYYNIQFKLYSASSGGSSLWTESYYDTNGVTAGNDFRVQVINGYITANLGSQTAFPTTINWDQDLYLTMNVPLTGGTTQTASPTWDGEMNPRLKLTGVPYAFRAGQLASLSGSNTSILQFASSIGQNTTITLPDPGASTATVCYQNDIACGFAAGSGSGNYIQNGTTTQLTANFNISGNGTAFKFNAVNALQTAGVTRVDASGNLTNIANITGTGTLQLTGTGSNYLMGALGLGVTNPQGALTVANSTWINGLDAAGTGYINMFQVNSANQIQAGAALNVDGGIILPTNGGQLTLVDIGIDNSATAGTKESYSLRVGSSNALTVYGEADGSGNAQNIRVAIGSSISPGYTLDVGGDVNLSSGSQFRINGSSICSSTGCITSGSYLQFAPASAQVDASSNNAIFINKTGGGNLLTLQAAGTTAVNVDSAGLTTFGGSAISAAGDYVKLQGSLTRNSTAATYGSALNVATTINPTSGSSNLSFIDITGTINQVGSTGTTNGILIRPTLTAAADFRALNIQSTSGYGIYQSSAAVSNYLGGSLNLNGTLTTFGATVNTVSALSDFPTGGAIGTAAATVDTKTAFTVNQTTVGQTLTIPSPTNTAAGRVIYITNIGSTSFTLGAAIIAPSTTANMVWSGTAWTFAGADASSILNQTASLQTANFNIQAATSSTNGTIGGSIQGAAGGQTVDLLQFKNTAGTVLSKFDASGSLGIGTASISAGYALDVAGSINTTGSIRLKPSTNSASIGSDNGGGLIFTPSGNASTGIKFTGGRNFVQIDSVQAGYIALTISQPSTPSSSTTAGTAAANIVNITGGNGGATTGTGFTAGVGGDFVATAGAGGTATASGTNGNGGAIILQGGAPGAGAGAAGSYGIINLQASGGSVGIGTSSPASKLDVRLSGSSSGDIISLGNSTTGRFGKLGIRTSDSAVVLSGDSGYIVSLAASGGTDNVLIGSNGSTTFKNTSNSGSAFVVQNASNNQVLTVDTSANSIILGKASTVDGKLIFQNAGSANAVTIVSGITSTSYQLTLPTALGASGDCLKDTTGGGVLGFGSCAAGGAGSGVTLQASTPGSADTGNFNISGVGIASTGFKGPSIDTVGSTTLTVGGTNATAITIGNSSSGPTVSILAGTGGVSIASGGIGNTVQVGNTTGAVSQTINIGNNATASSTNAVTIGSTVGSTVILQGATTKLTNDSTGINVQSSTNSATAFQVQNSSGAPILLVNTTTTVNLLTYPGFELGVVGSAPTGWSANGSATIQKQSTAVNTYHGLYSLQVATSGAGQGANTSSFTQTVASGTYVVSFYVKSSVGFASNLLTVTSTDSGTHTCTPSAAPAIVTTGFTRVSCSFTATGNITNLAITQSDATSRTLYIDGVQLQSGATVTAYQIGAIQLRGVINNPISLQALSNSTTAFQINDTAGTNVLTVDTLNSGINLTATTVAVTGNINVGGSQIISSGRAISGATGLTSVGATSLTGGVITLTANAASTWSTSSGLLTVSGAGGITVQAATTGTTTVNTVGAGTVLLATTNTTTLTIGGTQLTTGPNILAPVNTTSTKGVIIGTVDAFQTNLNLDNSSGLTEGATTCTSTVNDGAVYYNSATNAIRSCNKDSANATGNWEDVVTAGDLGIVMFGVVSDSGTAANQGDLGSTITTGVTGPCRVSWATSSSLNVAPCVVYSGGRKQVIAATTLTLSTFTTANIWAHVCVSSNAVAFTTPAATETANYPAWSANNPVLCIADVKTSTGTANLITDLYDTRTFVETSKEITTAGTLLALGQIVKSGASPAGVATTINSSAGQANVRGIVVAVNSTFSTTTPSVIIAAAGPAYVKATAATANLYLETTAGVKDGYADTAITAPTAIYSVLGIARSAYSNTCSSAANCNGSIYVYLNIR